MRHFGTTPTSECNSLVIDELMGPMIVLLLKMTG